MKTKIMELVVQAYAPESVQNQLAGLAELRKQELDLATERRQRGRNLLTQLQHAKDTRSAEKNGHRLPVAYATA